jgi:hypothetical protein
LRRYWSNRLRSEPGRVCTRSVFCFPWPVKSSCYFTGQCLSFCYVPGRARHSAARRFGVRLIDFPFSAFQCFSFYQVPGRARHSVARRFGVWLMNFNFSVFQRAIPSSSILRRIKKHTLTLGSTLLTANKLMADVVCLERMMDYILN